MPAPEMQISGHAHYLGTWLAGHALLYPVLFQLAVSTCGNRHKLEGSIIPSGVVPGFGTSIPRTGYVVPHVPLGNTLIRDLAKELVHMVTRFFNG